MQMSLESSGVELGADSGTFIIFTSGMDTAPKAYSVEICRLSRQLDTRRIFSSQDSMERIHMRSAVYPSRLSCKNINTSDPGRTPGTSSRNDFKLNENRLPIRLNFYGNK